MVAIPLKTGLQTDPITKGADPLEQFRIRGEKVKQELLLAGETPPLTATGVARLLNVSSEEVKRQRVQRELVAVSGKRGYLFPVWQFKDHSVLPGLAEVLDALEFKDEWTPLLFLRSGDHRLEGDTPLERLQTGELEAVISAARAYGQHNPA